MEKGKYYAIGSEVKEWTHFSGHSLRNCALVCSTVSQRPKVVHAYYMSGRHVQASMSVATAKMTVSPSRPWEPFKRPHNDMSHHGDRFGPHVTDLLSFSLPNIDFFKQTLRLGNFQNCQR